jgi:hypothetical protein
VSRNQCHCPKTYWNANTLRFHERSAHSLTTRLCDLCGKTFLSRGGLCNHQRKTHGTRQVRTFPCHMCTAVLTRLTDLHIHKVTVHGKNHWQCLACGQTNSNRTTLRKHWPQCQHDHSEFSKGRTCVTGSDEASEKKRHHITGRKIKLKATFRP